MSGSAYEEPRGGRGERTKKESNVSNAEEGHSAIEARMRFESLQKIDDWVAEVLEGESGKEAEFLKRKLTIPVVGLTTTRASWPWRRDSHGGAKTARIEGGSGPEGIRPGTVSQCQPRPC